MSSDPNPASSDTARFDQMSERRLEAVQRRLTRLRHQPLDPHVLDDVTRAERDAERWSRVTGALARSRAPVGLMEDPGSMMARVLNQVRESWRGTGLQVTGSFRQLDPQCFDRRIYMEAIRCTIDFVLSSFSRPRTLEGRLELDGGLHVYVDVEGDGARLDEDELELTRHLAERAGCAFEASLEGDGIAGALVLGNRRKETERPRYIFELKAS